jgi:transcription antitermination factor NusG
MPIWHIALTDPGADRNATSALRNRGYDVYRPIIPVFVKHGRGKLKTDWRSMFPGYLFVRDIRNGSWEWLRRTPGIRYGNRDDKAFLRVNGSFATINDESPDFRRMRLVEQDLAGTKPISEAKARFKEGDHIRVEEGPFTGLWGTIQSLDDTERVCLLMSLFGRESRVTIESSHLMPA